MVETSLLVARYRHRLLVSWLEEKAVKLTGERLLGLLSVELLPRRRTLSLRTLPDAENVPCRSVSGVNFVRWTLFLLPLGFPKGFPVE